jgi:hypothetical protein
MFDRLVDFSFQYYKEIFITVLVAVSVLYTKNRAVAMIICTILLFYYFYMIFFIL